MFDELVRSVRLHLSERLTSPLMGAFVISWCVWNYRFLIIVFSRAPLNETLTLIDQVVFPPSNFWIRGLVGPIATAFAYLFIYPYPARWVYTYSRKRQRQLLDVRRKIEDETPLTVEESRAIKRKVTEVQDAADNAMNLKDLEISRLKQSSSELEDQLRVATQELAKFRARITTTLNHDEVRTLQFFAARHPKGVDEKEVPTAFRKQLDSLYAQGLLKKLTGAGEYRLSDAGVNEVFARAEFARDMKE